MKRSMLVIFLLCVMGSSLLDAHAGQMKIGFADKMKILFEYEKTKELNQKLEKESNNAKAEFERRSEEVRKLIDEMELLSESARKEKQAELEKKREELDKFRREKMQDLGQRQDDGIREISEKVSAVCKKYGEDNGYDAIIDLRATVYVPAALDITDAIMKELNKKD